MLDQIVRMYLDDRMETLRSDCQRFSLQPLPRVLYPFEVVLNTLELLEENARLCHLVLKDPLKCQHLFKEAIYETIKRNNWIHQIENIGQVMVTLRVTRLPPLTLFQLDSVADVLSSCRMDDGKPRFRTFRGTVISLSTPSRYTLGATYSCSNARCSYNTVFWNCRFTRIHIPGAREKQTVSDQFVCVSCGNKLKENVEDRVLAEKVIGEIVPLKSIGRMSDLSEGSFRAQSVPVYFRGETMVNGVKIGRSYSIVTLPISKQPLSLEQSSEVALEANYVEEITFENRDYRNEQGADSVGWLLCTEMSRLLLELNIENLAYSPFIRPILMAYHFAGDVAPRGLFLKAKLGILFCLVNNCGKNKKIGSLLIVGRETSVIDHLLRYGASLASRCIGLTTHNQLTVATRHDTFGAGDDLLFVEANPILLASSGVCYLGDLAKFPNSSKRTITNILETGTVSVDLSSKTKDYSRTLPPTSMPVECQLWAYERGSSESRERCFASSSKTSNIGGSVPKYLLDAFGLVYFADFSAMDTRTHKDEELVDHCLNIALNRSRSNDTIFLRYLEKFLKNVRDRDLKFEFEAERLIQGYFVASRRVRGFDTGSSPLPLSALFSITFAAEGHAKLCQRETVTDDDAVAAIYLYEEYVTYSYGLSLLNIQPSPHSLDSDGCTQFNKLVSDMEQFGDCLRRYVKDYSFDKMSQRSEE